MYYRKSITATVYIINDTQELLLHQHKKYHTWFPVGGHLESDELPHMAAIREAFEETGLSISLLDTDIIRHRPSSVEIVPSPFCLLHEGIGSEEEFLDFIYIGFASNGDICPQAGESNVFKWFSFDELNCPDLDIKPHIRDVACSVLKFIGAKSE